VKLSVPGRHNVPNSLAAAALASHCGATGKDIRRGLTRFAGLRRRLELVADNGSVAVVDDYAHHPTEVAAALAAVREMYPSRRVVCVFQPHQASRTAVLLDEFARSLQNADTVVISGIFRAREDIRPASAAASHLADRVARAGVAAMHFESLAGVRSHLQRTLAAGDVMVTLGAGDIGAIAHDVGQGLRTIRKAG
jgi:UDP-N-acetylmuramate--alanine ligase